MTSVQTQQKTTGTKKLEGKVALVTGSSRGIGAAIAQKLAAEGATVAVNYFKSKEGAEKVVNAITEAGGKATAFQGNVNSKADGDKLIDEIVTTYGSIDILVNNAGVFDQRAIDQIDLDHFDYLFNTNVRGLVATTVAALPHLNNGGRIINISSIAADVVFSPEASIYSASKAAVNQLTRIWAQALGARQITVNGVAPGTTKTDMFNDNVGEGAHGAMAERTALGRMGESDDIADVVAFLASNDARWITGTTIVADGGFLAG